MSHLKRPARRALALGFIGFAPFTFYTDSIRAPSLPSYEFREVNPVAALLARQKEKSDRFYEPPACGFMTVKDLINESGRLNGLIQGKLRSGEQFSRADLSRVFGLVYQSEQKWRGAKLCLGGLNTILFNDWRAEMSTVDIQNLMESRIEPEGIAYLKEGVLDLLYLSCFYSQTERAPQRPLYSLDHVDVRSEVFRIAGEIGDVGPFGPLLEHYVETGRSNEKVDEASLLRAESALSKIRHR